MGDVVETVAATGTLEAVTTVQVGTQVSGTVRDLLADFNDIVAKGQVLARLDPSLFQTQVDQARANVSRSEADVERLRVGLADAGTRLGRARLLRDKQLVARADLEAAQVEVSSAEVYVSAQASVAQARASLNQAEVNLAHTVITSPDRRDSVVAQRRRRADRRRQHAGAHTVRAGGGPDADARQREPRRGRHRARPVGTARHIPRRRVSG